MRFAQLTAVLLIASWARLAVAGDDPYRVTQFERDGFVKGFAIGSGVFGGISGEGNIGPVLGAGLALRIGTTAGERLVWLLSLDVDSFLSQNAAAQTRTHKNLVFSVAAQYYVREVLWVRGGLGFASIATYRAEGNEQLAQLGGFAATGAVGYDLYRRTSLVVAAEAEIFLGTYRDRETDTSGASARSGTRISFTWY